MAKENIEKFVRVEAHLTKDIAELLEARAKIDGRSRKKYLEMLIKKDVLTQITEQ